jgi:hypothetical protein
MVERAPRRGDLRSSVWLGQETGHNKMSVWLGQEAGHNKIRPSHMTPKGSKPLAGG